MRDGSPVRHLLPKAPQDRGAHSSVSKKQTSAPPDCPGHGCARRGLPTLCAGYPFEERMNTQEETEKESRPMKETIHDLPNPLGQGAVPESASQPVHEVLLRLHGELQRTEEERDLLLEREWRARSQAAEVVRRA